MIAMATSVLNSAEEPCPAIGANLIALMTRDARARLEARFWRKTKENPETGCVEWTGALTTGGYGEVRIALGVNSKAHRVAHVLTCGPIPAGLLVLHGCHNPRCVNPAHLRLGTHAENMQDMIDAGRSQRGLGARQRKLCPVAALIVLGDQLLGLPMEDTARDLDVTIRTVAAIRAGDTWRAAVSAHLDNELAKKPDPADPA